MAAAGRSSFWPAADHHHGAAASKKRGNLSRLGLLLLSAIAAVILSATQHTACAQEVVGDCPDCGKVALPSDISPPPDSSSSGKQEARVVSVTPAPPAESPTVTTRQQPDDINDILPQKEPLALFTSEALRRAGLDGLLDDTPLLPGGAQRSNWTLFAPTVRRWRVVRAAAAEGRKSNPAGWLIDTARFFIDDPLLRCTVSVLLLNAHYLRLHRRRTRRGGSLSGTARLGEISHTSSTIPSCAACCFTTSPRASSPLRCAK